MEKEIRIKSLDGIVDIVNGEEGDFIIDVTVEEKDGD